METFKEVFTVVYLDNFIHGIVGRMFKFVYVVVHYLIVLILSFQGIFKPNSLTFNQKFITVVRSINIIFPEPDPFLNII